MPSVPVSKVSIDCGSSSLPAFMPVHRWDCNGGSSCGGGSPCGGGSSLGRVNGGMRGGSGRSDKYTVCLESGISGRGRTSQNIIE
jgi:hypothetical protein